MRRVVGVTGTPGTGKKSISPLLAKSLKLRCLSLTDLARSYGLGAEDEEGEVDTSRLKRMLKGKVVGPALIYGHLLPYSLKKSSAERVVVLRCEPRSLKRRLVRRGYPWSKVLENVEAELIGVVSADAHDAFGALAFEVDTTSRRPSHSAREALAILRGVAEPSPRIDWTVSYDSGPKLGSLLGRE